MQIHYLLDTAKEGRDRLYGSRVSPRARAGLVDENRVYSRGEQARLRASARDGVALICPRCIHPLVSRRIPPRSEVSYVRARIWWICNDCGRSVVLDIERNGLTKKINDGGPEAR